ncbi:hypothetical protein [Chroococcidiopsis sp. CCMEE 29]|uniref:hypothetical protein n=1 Tax=Chroococcidiopsis sp. CCMEE 29 TaxID=155894 RepID=UPI002021BC8E|nr:hypothetical protein [Chroococcidiopsis sp. CCMEE 29]
MASEQEVRQYLAYWFQLGKKVLIRNGQESLLPQPVIQGDRYSQEFEDCWQQILAAESGDSYLEGTEETVTQLLTPGWNVSSCARCEMPVPIRNIGMPPLSCPCNDLSSWPNTEVPAPRSPVNTQAQLTDIRNRLLSIAKSKTERSDF